MARIATPQTFDHAGFLALLGGKDEKSIGNNRRVINRNGDVAVRLHATDIVTFRPDGSIVLNSGGYKTATTKNAMNEVLPASLRVFQKARQWKVLVRRVGLGGQLASMGQDIDFTDGMTVTA